MTFFGRLENPSNYAEFPPQNEGEFLILYQDCLNFTRVTDDSQLLDEVFQLRKHINDTFDVVDDFTFLSMFVVRCDPRELKALKNWPRFEFAVQTPRSVQAHRPVLNALNALHNQASFQAYQWVIDIVKPNATLPNDRYEGGIWPAGPYPICDEASSITANRNLHYLCGPAQMPVLNLSLGPNIPDRISPILFALAKISQTYLLTIAAGNGGPDPEISTINHWAPTKDVLRVGATTDDTGHDLAEYSSRGIESDAENVPDVVACGVSEFDPQKNGTSFAAPRVAMLGCIGFGAIAQLARISTRAMSADSDTGIPLMGLGLVDMAGGDYADAALGREKMPGLPFVGVYEDVALEAFAITVRHGQRIRFMFSGEPMRRVIMDSARPVPGRGLHEVGAGFVNERLFLDFLSQQPLEYYLRLFCDGFDINVIPARLRAAKVFDRRELALLSSIIKRTMPIWFYNYSIPQFSVNPTQDDQPFQLPLTGQSHGFDVMYSVRQST